MFRYWTVADRVAGLEKANGRIRDRAKMLLEKSDADDRLVDALRNELHVRFIKSR